MAEAYFALGEVYAENDRETEALSYYRWAISFKPDYADAYYNCGELYAVRGRGSNLSKPGRRR